MTPEKRYNTITPWITTKDTRKLIDFLVNAFDAIELGTVPNEDGSIGHAEVQIGDSKIMMFDSHPDWPAFPCLINLYVEDSQRLYNQALEHGATSMTEITTQAWGDRGGRIIDPFGNVWWITSQVETVSEAEMYHRLTQPEYIEAMNYAQQSFTLQHLMDCQHDDK